MKGIGWTNVSEKQSRISFLWLPLAALVLIWSLACNQIRDPDFWWHLRTGQVIVETRTIPSQDPFSFSAAGRPWTAHEWLFEVALFLLYRAGGLAAVIAAKAFLITVTTAVVWGLAWSATRQEALATLVALLTTLATLPGWAERPQLLTYLFVAILLVLLREWQQGGSPRLLGILPFLTVIWVNVHGAYIVEFMVLGVYIAVGLGRWWKKGRPVEEWKRVRFLLALSALCATASLLNPHTYRAWLYPFQYVGPSVHKTYIAEWRPMDFGETATVPFLILLVSTVVALLWIGRSFQTENAVLWGFFTLMALQSQRHLPLAALAAAPVLAECLGTAWQTWQARVREKTPGLFPATPRLAWGLPVLGSLMGLLAAQGAWASWQTIVQTKRPWYRTFFPVAAVTYLQAHPQPRRMFNHYAWGGYLIWHLPQQPVFIDGRADMYGPEIMKDYHSVCSLKPGWKEILAKYRIDSILCPAGQPLAAALAEMETWNCIYSDKISVLFCLQSARYEKEERR